MRRDTLSVSEVERLALLSEEAAEVQHMVGKCLRHGWFSSNPHAPEDGTNEHRLAVEVGHFLHAVDRLIADRNLDPELIQQSRAKKAETIVQYLHHQPPRPLNFGLTRSYIALIALTQQVAQQATAVVSAFSDQLEYEEGSDWDQQLRALTLLSLDARATLQQYREGPAVADLELAQAVLGLLDEARSTLETDEQADEDLGNPLRTAIEKLERLLQGGNREGR